MKRILVTCFSLLGIIAMCIYPKDDVCTIYKITNKQFENILNDYISSSMKHGYQYNLYSVVIRSNGKEGSITIQILENNVNLFAKFDTTKFILIRQSNNFFYTRFFGQLDSLDFIQPTKESRKCLFGIKQSDKHNTEEGEIDTFNNLQRVYHFKEGNFTLLYSD